MAGVDKDANDNSIPIQGIYANTTITNSGLIEGQTESGIVIDGSATSFLVTISNTTGGIIEGTTAPAAVIRTGSDVTTINEYGAITANGSGKAIDFVN